MEEGINSEFSKRISVLRFPLAVFIVFIHNRISGSSLKYTEGEMDIPLWIKIIHDTFVYYWGGIAVPMFFIISAYLFFAKPKPVKKIIKSKFKGIVIPYFLWISSAIILYYIAQSFDYTQRYFCEPEKIIRNWSLYDYVKAFFATDTPNTADNSLHTPFVAPFWYIRDLIIMMLLSPIIKKIAGKLPIIWLVFVTGLHIAEKLNIINIQYGLTTALFYFSLGYYAVKYIGTFMKLLDSINWIFFIIIYLFVFILLIYTNVNSIHGGTFIKYFITLFTICLAIKVAGVVSKNSIILGKLSYLSGFSFWVFAAHLPIILPLMKKISYQFIPMHGILILVQFFGVVILCVGFLLIFGIAVKKYLPKVYALLNGGR